MNIYKIKVNTSKQRMAIRAALPTEADGTL